MIVGPPWRGRRSLTRGTTCTIQHRARSVQRPPVPGAGSLRAGQRDRRDRANLCFVGICACNAVMALGDLTSWAFAAPLDATGHAIMLAGTFAFYAAPLPCSYASLATSWAISRNAPPISHNYFRLSFILFSLYMTGCVAFVVQRYVLRGRSTTSAMRGPLFWLAQVIPVALHLQQRGHRGALPHLPRTQGASGSPATSRSPSSPRRSR